MDSGMGLADVMAVAKDNDGFLEGNGIIILILFFLIFGFGGNGFGGGGQAATNQITNEFLFNNLNNSVGRLADATNAGFTNIGNGICNLGYETLANFKDMQAQMAACCCRLETNQDKNTQLILDKMCQTEINTLRDSLQSANLTLANQSLAQSIVQQVRPMPNPAWVVGSPYQSACNCGCGC